MKDQLLHTLGPHGEHTGVHRESTLPHCTWCGSAIVDERTVIKRNDQIFCCKECSNRERNGRA